MLLLRKKYDETVTNYTILNYGIDFENQPYMYTSVCGNADLKNEKALDTVHWVEAG